ncbi:methyltransferase domain-containing protein [Streptomyces sp. NBC_00335]|uniref:class I SAM-dependent methyltransferase n=1 Tax=unclassified Streptomyces TaxID=2593676 RepID=UPI00225BCE6A|nr:MULTISPECIES: class I SAM-dependent methyltransferase [unclassified Streptomyces]MCX5409650.1 methyltransferase domain-containing protein [Streptomyces sp. NBC_00086]
MDTYDKSVLGHEVPGELERLRRLEALADPLTRKTLDRIGMTSTWRCLDVGAGAGSVARHLAQRATAGHVTATDLDTRFLPLDVPNLLPLKHDACVDDFPAESFDLIHARLVLDHLPDRESTLRRMIGWLAPGGWLYLGGLDVSTSLNSPYRPVLDGVSRFASTMTAQMGTDLRFTRRATSLMRSMGLRHVGIDCAPIILGDRGEGDRFFGIMLKQFQTALPASDQEAHAELRTATEWLAAPTGVEIGGLFTAAWGQRG